MFLSRLLDYERRIFETTLSWRSYILCVQSFVHLPYLLSSEQIQTKILPRVFSRIYSVRKIISLNFFLLSVF